MDLHELRVAARLIDGLAKRALFAEKQMVALEGQCAEWKRIADELKAERNAAKQEAVSARQDAVTRAEADRKRIDGLMIQAQDMRAEIERLKKPRQHPVKAGEYVKNDNGDVCQVHEVYAEEYLLNTGWTWAFENCTPCDPPEATHDTPAEIERLKKTARKHPVAVGEWVLRTGGGGAYPIGTVAQVNQYSPSGDYLVRLAGQTRIVTWFKENCTPCDPPEATHDTPEGRSVAEATVKREPKPGDVVRLVRVPSEDTVGDTLRKSLEWPWKSLWGSVGDRGEIVESVGTMPGARSVRIMNTGVKVWWPLSCVEIVKGGE